MCLGRLLPEFYPDLANPEYVTQVCGVSPALCDEHVAGVAPRAAGAQAGHNGEINTVWGNRSRMAARDSTLPVECKPVLTKDGTDSTRLMRPSSC